MFYMSSAVLAAPREGRQKRPGKYPDKRRIALEVNLYTDDIIINITSNALFAKKNKRSLSAGHEIFPRPAPASVPLEEVIDNEHDQEYDHQRQPSPAYEQPQKFLHFVLSLSLFSVVRCI